MAFVEDVAAYLADFGVDATLNGEPVRGIFDDAYGDAFGLVAGTGPRFLCSCSVAAAEGDSIALALGGSGYTVASVQPDGTGMQVLILEAVA